jgi:hypothetical protein
LVRDQDSMRALYGRIGEREPNSYRFDTKAAIDVGRRVRLDLLDANTSQPHRGPARVTPAR